jgi:GDP-L-fucose synthase
MQESTSKAKPTFSWSNARVWVAGHAGLVGTAIARRLAAEGCELLRADRGQLDLRRQDAVKTWMRNSRPDVVIVAAATVGGIQANRTRPAEFLHDNLMIVSSIIEGAHESGVRKVTFLSSSCVYPRLAPQPMAESSMLTGELEPTNEWYAIAKIAGQKLCDAYRRQYGSDFISIVPATIYGPGDNFDLEGGHVLPSLLRRFHEAKVDRAPSVALWGSGSPVREFLYVDDFADAVAFLSAKYAQEGPINVGAPATTSIRELATAIAHTVGYQGGIAYDTTKPDGMPCKFVDASRLRQLGWQATTPLATGLETTYRWLTERLASGAPVRGWPTSLATAAR